MKSLRTFAVAAAAALLSLAPLTAQVTDYHEIKTPALHAFHPAQPTRVVLPNGMVLFLMEDHELPLIRGFARIRGGAHDVPAAKAGLVQIYGEAWRTGGTEAKTGDQLDDFLESRAAIVESSGGEESTSLSLNVLKGDFDTVLPIFVDLLQHPAFRQDKIDLAKTHVNTGISRRNDDPSGIVRREAKKLAFGNSPYTYQAEYATVAGVTRDDLLAFHKQYVHPNNILFGIVGDFDTAAMEKKLRAAFASWPKGPEASKAPVPAGAQAKPGVYFITKDDVTQSNIGIVEQVPAITRNNPDYYPIAVMNEILGGGFSGRLMNHIRSQMGLAYGVGGGVAVDFEGPAVLNVGMGTKSGTTVKSVTALRNELTDLVSKPITAQEVADAKETIANSFIFTMDSKAKVLQQRMTLEFYGYPADYYQHYLDNIAKVTPADVERVAKKYVNPANAAVLVVGKEKEFDQPLASLGTVSTVDITIPEPGAAPAGAKPAASNAEGTALAKKVLAFFGGAAKVNSIQAVRQVGVVNTKTPMGMMEINVDSTTKFPDSTRNVMKTPMGEMTMVVTPETAFMIGPNGAQELPGSQAKMIRSEEKNDELSILRNLDNPKYAFTVKGTEKVGDVTAPVLEINADGSVVKWVVDPASGKILRRSTHGMRGETVREYTEWKTFDGINVPVAFKLTNNGEDAGSGKITTFEVNPTIDPNAFVKPAAK